MAKISKAGLSPGSLVYVGPATEARLPRFRLIRYNEQTYSEEIFDNLPAINPDNETVTWLDIDGVHDKQTVERVGEQYGIHALALEDLMNTRQETKIEFYEDAKMFVVLKMLRVGRGKSTVIEAEQISFFLTDKTLVSFQEQRNYDVFEPILERLKVSIGKTRKNCADYLLFATIDYVVDNYLLVLERISEQLDQLEDDIFKNKQNDPLPELYALKRELTLLRKHAWPLREVLHGIIRNDADIIKPVTLPYFRDVLDHINQVLEATVSHKELLNGLMDIHYSIISNRMNSVMKTLTIYSAVFMPLTFIVGIYGMNFDNIPELHQQNGYFWTLGAMAALSMGLLFYFRRRGWL